MRYEWYRKGFFLLEEIEKTQVPEHALAVWYLGQMGIIVKGGGLTLCFDPVLNDLTRPDNSSRRNFAPPFAADQLGHVDYIVGSHGHADHINMLTLLPLQGRNPDAKFIVPAPEAHSLAEGGIRSDSVISAKAGKAIALGREGTVGTLYPVAAPHEEYVTDADGNQRNLSYLLELNGIRLFHCGDAVVTERLIRDVSCFRPIHLACLPVNGLDAKRRRAGIIGNMDCRDAAFFAQQIEADLTIPMHYDMVAGNEENPLVFAHYMQEFYPGRKYHIMQLGERLIVMS